MKRIAIALIAAALLAGGATPAAAAQPNNQACLGIGVSTDARAGGADFGAFVAGVARFSPIQGVGDEVQALLAGDVPDTELPNVCND